MNRDITGIVGFAAVVFGTALWSAGSGCSSSSKATGGTANGKTGSNSASGGSGSKSVSSGSGGQTSSVETGASGKGAKTGTGGTGKGGTGGDSSGSGSGTGGQMSASGPPPPPGPPGCGLMHAAFCDTFDTASPGGRGGDLDDANWSVARISGNFVRGVSEPWPPTTASACGETRKGVIPDSDIFFCAGGGTASMHMNDVEDDNGGFTIHSYQIRKQFDFTDRTGIIAFDVGGRGQIPGGHGNWFNVTIADQPVPAPYQQGGEIALFAKAAVLIEFEGGSGGPYCPDDGTGNSVSTIYIEKDYKITDTYQYLVDRMQSKACFKTVEEVMNHIEIHISQTSIEVFASDAGDPGSFRSITKVDKAGDGLNLPLTRGYVNLQQTHYNGGKCATTTLELHPDFTPAQVADVCGDVASSRTYHWDNIAFDGPSYPTPRAYEVPDSLNSFNSGTDPFVDIGYGITQNGAENHDGPISPFVLPKVDLTDATDAALTLNAWHFCPGHSIGYRFNGGPWRQYACPFPLACDGCGDGNIPAGECNPSARAVYIPLDLADLKSGNNTLEFQPSSDPNADPVLFANVDLSVNVKQ